MKVLILGFDNYNELDRTMQKLIEESQFFLFNTLCGGLDMVNREKSIAETWAEKNGSPIVYIQADDLDSLIKKLLNECDYLVIKINDKTPQWQKNFMMQIKAQGKHGTVVR